VDSSAPGYAAGKAVMLISTPYDKGWQVRVDGEPVVTTKGLETFLSFYLADGEHEIEMIYEPRGLKAGSMLSAAGLLVILGFAAAGMIRKKKESAAGIPEQDQDNPEQEPAPEENHYPEQEPAPEDNQNHDEEMEL
jgi:hypothetical protein